MLSTHPTSDACPGGTLGVAWLEEQLEMTGRHGASQLFQALLSPAVVRR